jgi:hypothetical protein
MQAGARMRASINSRPPKDTQMTNDQNLKQSVLDELNWEPSINSASIGVTAKDGVVTLTGNVETFSQKHAAELAALRVHDVKAVAEEIEVKLPFDGKRCVGLTPFPLAGNISCISFPSRRDRDRFGQPSVRD